MANRDGGPAFPCGISVSVPQPLTQIEAGVYKMRQAGMTLVDVGKELGMTRERVRSIQAKADYKMNMAESHRLPGMSLRDWFAGQALAGAVTRDPDTVGVSDEACDEDVLIAYATWAYDMADAMLAARKEADDGES